MLQFRVYGKRKNGGMFYEAWENQADWSIEDMIIRSCFNNKFYSKWNIEYRTV